jgi:hypothetical protein
MFMVYLQTKLHFSSSNDSLVIALKIQANKFLHAIAIFLPEFKTITSKRVYLSNIYVYPYLTNVKAISKVRMSAMLLLLTIKNYEVFIPSFVKIDEVKNEVFWDVASCRSCVHRRFGGTYHLHLQGRNIRERGTSMSRWLRIFLPWKWRLYIPPKRRFTQDVHGATYQNTAFSIVTAVKTWNLT